jgi:hypothetical protein
VILLSGRGYSTTYESPKNEDATLFNLGERAYDHLLILPSKSKGTVYTKSMKGNKVNIQKDLGPT